MNVIYTIGHSSHSSEYFLEILKKHNINCVIDIRSVPFSKYVPHFNKDIIKSFLNNHGIYCLYMAREFGARQEDINLFTKEKYLDFEKVRSTDFFKKGIERVLSGMHKGYIIALMCTEKDPINCHRSIMISPVFDEMGYEVNHILEDGSIETQSHFEDRLIDLYFPNKIQQDFFHIIEGEKDRSELLLEAYRFRNRDIGFRLEDNK